MFSNQIRSRIFVYFIASSAIIFLVLSALSLLFSYLVEDSLFDKLLKSELSHVQQQIENGQMPEPNLSFVSFYASKNELPKAIQGLLNEEPNRIEFPGDNDKHYHLKALDSGYLVAEVSEYLIVRDMKSGMFKTQFIFLLLTACVVAFVSWRLAKRIVKPIDNLMDVLSEVDAQTIPSGFSDSFAHDEIGLFAKKLDLAMHRIDQFIQREQQFTRDVSHELRTPIAISDGALTLIKGTDLQPDQITLINRIADAQKQMQSFISALLALARETDFEQETISLLPLLEACIVEHHGLLEGKDIALHLDVSRDVCLVSNKQALAMIVGNLLANAFQHTQQGVINIAYQDNRLDIRDSGEGIAPEIYKDVYRTGVKGEQSAGFGIGLSLVKRLCEKVDISISISSDNSGTLVRLTLPTGRHDNVV
ncbi:sensor histidine kinase [Thalassotalea agarivorans]|uniref:histidine kinase n=1 Tax=Thalassotalea agarivorans TaxID=349064 RepID=A0A1I0HPD7_THASX|nr:HAMP domain-containing sensor histidine kinase [Thalassotalea agarivorans]SET85834.1 Signal transduction histidine kinase [Thalassotalea agarivorans]